MSTVAEILEAVKELPETEKGVLFRERDPLREPEASRGSLARKNGRWVLRGGEAAAAADAWETTRESRSRELPGCGFPDTSVPVASNAAAGLFHLLAAHSRRVLESPP